SDERARRGLGGVTLEKALVDAAADHLRRPCRDPLERPLEFEAELRCSQGFPAEQDPACERLRVRIRSGTEVDIDEGCDLGDGIAARLSESAVEVGVMPGDQIPENREQDLLLVLEMVMNKTGRKARRLGDVGDGGAVI